MGKSKTMAEQSDTHYYLVFGRVESAPVMNKFLAEHYFAMYKKNNQNRNHKVKNHKL